MKYFLITVLLISSLFSNKIEDAYILVAQDNVDNNVVKKAYLMAKDDFKDDLYLIDKKYFYMVAAEYILRFKDCKPINTIEKFYNKIKDIDVIPISYLKAQCLANDKNSTTAKIELYKQAIKEDSTYDLSYYYLAALYGSEEKYDKVIPILKKALKKSISTKSMKALFHSLLAGAYFFKVSSSNTEENCIIEKNEGKEMLKKAVSEAEKALVLDSSVKGASSILANAYSSLGYKELALIANSGLKNSTSKIERYSYEYNLISNGKKDEYFKIIKDGKDTNNTNLIAKAYICDQNWSEAVKYQKDVVKKSSYFYDFLRYAVVNYALGKSDEAKKIIQNVPEKSLDNEWKKSLKANYSGKLSDQKLLKEADNVCKQTEANYYIGIKYLSKDKTKAKEYFQKVVDLKAYGYVEYTASKYFLKEGIK